MSDIDSYSDSDESFGGDNENIIRKPINKNSLRSKYDNEDLDDGVVDDSEQEDIEDTEDEDDDDDENKIGGATGDDEESDEDVKNDGNESDDYSDEENEVDEPLENPTKNNKPKKTIKVPIEMIDDDEDDEYEENYLQKFDYEINKNYINEFHPECLNHNSDEVSKLARVIRDSNNIIIDPFHKTLPYLTKYEKARVLGQRAKQIESGAKPLVKVPENIIDGYIIAELELREKKIPFIIKRPIPGGAFEYWYLKDLENIHF